MNNGGFHWVSYIVGVDQTHRHKGGSFGTFLSLQDALTGHPWGVEGAWELHERLPLGFCHIHRFLIQTVYGFFWGPTIETAQERADREIQRYKIAALRKLQARKEGDE